MRLSLLPIAIFFTLIGLFLSKDYLVPSIDSQNPNELAIASWNDGTDAFYEQVLKSNGSWVDNAGTPIFDNKPVATLPQKLANNTSTQVLGSHIAADGSEKWVEVDLSDLKLYAWEGNRKVHEFSVSTGRPGYNTPTGEFRVWRKVLSQTYKGGSRERGDYYYLPNVSYSLFFGGGNVRDWKGYAIHGAYWHNDFGIKNRSSGCINVKPEEAGLLYSWAGPAMPEGVNALNASDDNPGIRVVIHE